VVQFAPTALAQGFDGASAGIVSHSLLCPIFAPAGLSREPQSVTASGELAPVKAEVNDKQRGKSKGDHADGG